MNSRVLAVGGIALASLGAGALTVRARLASPVETVSTRVEEVVEEVRGPGVVGARIQAGVGSRVAGTVAEVFVDVGDLLEAGAPVARLEDSALRARLAAAGSGVDAAGHALALARAEEARAVVALDLARRTAARQVALAREGVAAASAADEAMAALRAAAAALESARAARSAKSADLARAGEERVVAAVEASYAHVVAPFAGLVTSRRANPGDAAVPGASLVELVDPASAWVTAWIDESLVGRVRVGQPARLRLRSGWAGEGHVVRLARRADPVSRELEVDVAFIPDVDRLTLDEEAEVVIEIGRVRGMSVPSSALVATGGERHVFVVRAGRALPVPVRVGARGAERTIIDTELEADARVVRDPRGLAPGTRVRAVAVEP
ncbi:MAG: HlyD family efflux transporter periplasmic adaptor subunit [Thermoanaerobaculia bacterium]|nr:HlyD family efflux transporter periplasmic adaptor subunit [Thermoanaerobaculia bacterium]